MAFRTLDISAHMTKFNSATSSNLIDIYEGEVEKEIAENNSRPKNRTIAPSSFRCMRYNWFRLRGTEPDKTRSSDIGLQFTADIGTACHEMIQARLSRVLKDNWLDVEDYMNNNSEISYEFSVNKKGYESQISITDPPVKFACDGVLKLNGKIYLLEIKTSEFGAFNELANPKPEHVDQIQCYASLLHIEDALVLYQDRQYGSIKCFEMKVSEHERNEVLDKIKYIQNMASANIAPEGLPVGNKYCSPSMCIYYKKCQQWGR